VRSALVGSRLAWVVAILAVAQMIRVEASGTLTAAADPRREALGVSRRGELAYSGQKSRLLRCLSAKLDQAIDPWHATPSARNRSCHTSDQVYWAH
jgi:hypothetical protein